MGDRAVEEFLAKILFAYCCQVFKFEDFFKSKQENRLVDGVVKDFATSNRLRIIAV